MKMDAACRGQPKACIDRQDGITIAQHPVAIDNDQCVRIGRVYAMAAKQRRPRLPLHGGEPEASYPVTRQDKLCVGRTQDAFGVKHNDGSVMFGDMHQLDVG